MREEWVLGAPHEDEVSGTGSYAVVIADFHGPVTLVPGTGAAPRFTAARNALGPGMSASALAQGPSLWLFPPSSPEEATAATALRQRATAGIDGVTADFILLDIGSDTRSGHLRTVSRGLWPAFSLPEKEAVATVEPPNDDDWSAYRSVNAAFARCISGHASLGARVMVRDLELLLLPRMLRELRPDVSISFFSFAAWSTVGALRGLPAHVVDEIAASLAVCDDAGFLSSGSAARFDAAMRALGRDTAPAARAFPLPIDSAEIAEKAFSSAADGLVDRVDRETDRSHVIARAERAERPANLLGGLEAFRRLLTLFPQWRGRVVHLNAVFPGSLDPWGQQEIDAAEDLAARINAEFGTPTWRPIEFTVGVDYLRSLALMRVADVFIANPALESMSITTWEALELNERSAAFVLSSASGVAELFPEEALVVDANDPDATACAMHEALTMPEHHRRERLLRMRMGVRSWSPAEWFAAQLAEGRPSPPLDGDPR